MLRRSPSDERLSPRPLSWGPFTAGLAGRGHRLSRIQSISDGEAVRSGPALRSLGHPFSGVGSESPTVHTLTPNASGGPPTPLLA
jgi:hypothetical protein